MYSKFKDLAVCLKIKNIPVGAYDAEWSRYYTESPIYTTPKTPSGLDSRFA